MSLADRTHPLATDGPTGRVGIDAIEDVYELGAVIRHSLRLDHPKR
jgi:hypothetical protein